MQLSHQIKRHSNKIIHLVTLATLLGVLSHAPATLAWKPTTHVYFAEKALEDALDDGKVTIYRVDYQSGKVLSKLGDYPVDPDILAALRSYPAQYRAGVLGPDAYPDILTGQQVIHPNPIDTGIDGGSGTWLKYLWDLVNTPGNNTLQNKAFVVGFLTHAAGDMYGHTFINNFTGGSFAIKPPEGPINAIKHIVIEGYVDKRLDQQALNSDFFNVSIAGVDDFIYRSMIDARSGSNLDSQLLKADSKSTNFSVPRIYSTLRSSLQRDIDAYYAKKTDYDRLYDNCRLLDFSCSRIAITAKKAAYVAANGPVVTYKEFWRDDIDSGLRAWPGVSHEVAKALFFNPARQADTQKAEDILQKYVTDHLLSMSGAPDFVGLTAGVISDIIDAITPNFLLEPIRQLKEDLLNTMLKSAIGMTKQELKEYLTSPDKYFDQVMTTGSGKNVTLQQFNAKYLKINDLGYNNPNEAFDYTKFPAGYNTVTMSKLLLLSKDGVNQMLADLGSSTKLAEENIMLGFIQTLDGDNEWLGEGQPQHPKTKMVLAQNCQDYRQIFMMQPGERSCISASFQTSNGSYIVAEEGGGGDANANRSQIGPWETFSVIDINGGTLQSLDPVCIATYNSNYLVAENGGGDVVRANRVSCGPWEKFNLIKVTPEGAAIGGEIQNNDLVALRVNNGQYVVAEEGGGSKLNANRGAIGPWEIFRITLR